MRHRNITVKLGRTKSPREALFNELARQIIVYERIRTTAAKAKALRPIVERLITRGRDNTLATKRELTRTVKNPLVVKKILTVLGPRYKDRPGGYLRIVKLAARKGDAAPIVQIEFV